MASLQGQMALCAIRAFYWVTGASLLFLLVYRILITRFAARKQARVAS
jgi:hypothetical protein